MQRGGQNFSCPGLSTNAEITACKKKLQALLLHLQKHIDENQRLKRRLAQASSVVSGFQGQIAELEAAIEAAKCDLHDQIFSHEELLGLKHALGAEIATYWELLDGEELSTEASV
ncbi:keratin, type II cytoskeletal 7-like [Hoplias malabaricus]|uniref:keratin, type II cytoskeletal 7-like n=1 Tax=Hoplias malabaricus TaxID=27720 RepID=UPI00346241B2